MKKIIAMILVIALTAAISVGATLAYLTDTDEDVNVMTMGNVSIAQHEYQRATNEDGSYKTDTIDDQNSYVLEVFEQNKPLLPYVGDPANEGWDEIPVRMTSVDSYGSMSVFVGKNAVDKFVTVENTGKTDAYVRTLVAIEYGTSNAGLVGVSYHTTWQKIDIGTITIDGNNYYVCEYAYKGGQLSDGSWRHENGILPAGDTSYPSLAQVYLKSEATNEDCAALDGNGNGTLDILVLSQAVQAAGFPDADTALNAGFGETNATNAVAWFSGLEFPVLGTQVSADNIADIDFTAENTKFVFNGEFGAVNISELGNGSVLALNNATIGDMTLGSDATVTGTGTLNKINTTRNSAEAVTLNIMDATLDIAGELGVRNTDNKSILNIENSNVYFGTIFVGEHTNNHGSALAEFNVINSYLSGYEESLGSTIAVWGQSGVSSKIYDSEIYTYSRGWHQSEDANDNSITFQGANSIDVDIQRSNMHLYGARSIINARKYANAETTVDFTIDESLIWVVTKSTHGEDTLPVWGTTEITDSILLFTKDRTATTPIFKSFVYGNPVIHGEYHVTTQCEWDAPIALADGQTVTFASDANVSIYEGAGNVEFVKTGSAKVVLEDGATVTNIGGLE